MYAFFKRTMDILFAGLALIVLSPVMLIIALLVRVKLGGPVIFVNYRPGKDGKVFPLYKFRSMSNAKDENGDLLSDEMRHTKFGRMLRKTSLDELPQLINILKGDMSLIGPRPRLIKDALFYGIEGNEVYSLSVRPGISGQSQVYGRNENTWASVFKHDEYYVKHMSLWQDIKIFFKTFVVIFKSSQAEKEEFKYYCDEVYAKKIITKEQYEAGLQRHKEMERNCSLGLVQYVETYAPIASAKKTKVKKVNTVTPIADDDEVQVAN